MSRHPSVTSLLRWLRPNPKLPPRQLEIAEECETLAIKIINSIPNDSSELSAGLRKLLEAKDCFIRASMEEATNG